MLVNLSLSLLLILWVSCTYSMSCVLLELADFSKIAEMSFLENSLYLLLVFLQLCLPPPRSGITLRQ